MTEAEWVSCTDPRPMLGFLYRNHPITNRRWALFDEAWCRDLWPHLNEKEKRVAETVGVFADAEPGGTEAAFSVYLAATEGMAELMNELFSRQNQAQFATQADFLRDIAGNPFRPITIDPSWLTPTVNALAQKIYDDRTFDRLPILADSLIKSGCDNQEILGHLKGPGAHVRGCWVVDGVLGKR